MEYEIIKDEDFFCQLASDGSLNINYKNYCLISKDILIVKEEDGSYDYFIPEEEKPPFATLLHPLDKGKEKINYLDINQSEKNNIKFVTCQGKKTDIVSFVKTCFLYSKEKKVSIEIIYELLKQGTSLRYFLVLPYSFYNECSYIIKYANCIEKNGVFGQKVKEETDGKKSIKSLKIISRFGPLYFLPGENTYCQLITSYDKMNEQNAYYLLLEPDTETNGILKVEIILDNNSLLSK